MRLADGQQLDMDAHVADFFVVVGMPALWRCKERSTDLFCAVWHAEELDRLPAQSEVPTAVPMFCFPDGVQFAKEHAPPSFFTFVLTSEVGDRLHCAALKVWDEVAWDEVCMQMDLDRAAVDAMVPVTHAYVPKVLLVAGQQPLYGMFKMFLSQVFRLSYGGTSSVPIERHIENLLFHVPMPPEGVVQVQYTCMDRTLLLERPAPNTLPRTHFSLETLFLCLDVENVLTLLACVFTEQKIIITSSQVSLLNEIIDSLECLMFPFRWQSVCVPMVSSQLCEMVHAPVPFLMGFPTATLLELELRDGLPTDIVCVHLDRNLIALPEDVEVPPLPERQAVKLARRLRESMSIDAPPARDVLNHNPSIEQADSAFRSTFDIAPVALRNEVDGSLMDVAPKEAKYREAHALSRSLSHAVKPVDDDDDDDGMGAVQRDFFDHDAVQESVFKFVLGIMKDYRRFLVKSDATDTLGGPLLRRKEFIAQFPESSRAFMHMLTNAQFFHCFLDERASAAAPEDMPSTLRFFDESIDAKWNRKQSSIWKRKRPTPFLNDRSFVVQKTHIPHLLGSEGLDDDAFSYTSFPRLRLEMCAHFDAHVQATGTDRGSVAAVMRSRRRGKPTLRRAHTRMNMMLHFGNTMTRSSAAQAKQWALLTLGIVRMQALVRGFLARKHYAHMRALGVSEEDRARNALSARRIQAWWRRVHARRQRAAAVLQAAVRMWIQRAWYRAVLAAVVRAQAAMRMFAARRAFHRLRTAAIVAQACVRMARARRHYLRVQRGVRRTQAIVRGHMCRVRARARYAAEVPRRWMEAAKACDAANASFIFRATLLAPTHEPSLASLALLRQGLRQLRGRATPKGQPLAVQREGMYFQFKTQLPAAVLTDIYALWDIRSVEKKKKRRLAMQLFASPQDEQATLRSAHTVERMLVWYDSQRFPGTHGNVRDVAQGAWAALCKR